MGLFYKGLLVLEGGCFASGQAGKRIADIIWQRLGIAIINEKINVTVVTIHSQLNSRIFDTFFSSKI